MAPPLCAVRAKSIAERPGMHSWAGAVTPITFILHLDLVKTPSMNGCGEWLQGSQCELWEG